MICKTANTSVLAVLTFVYGVITVFDIKNTLKAPSLSYKICILYNTICVIPETEER